MKAKIVRVDTRFILSALDWPADVKIIDIRVAFDLSELIEIVVEHESFEDVPTGNVIPDAHAICNEQGFVEFK